MTDARSAVRRQLDLEEEGMALGIARYHARDLPWKDGAGGTDEEANLPPGQQLLKVAIGPVVEAIKELIEQTCSGRAGRKHAVAPFLLAGEPLEVAYLTLRCVVNACTGEESLQAVGLKVAKAVQGHLSYMAFKEVNRTGYIPELNSRAINGRWFSFSPGLAQYRWRQLRNEMGASFSTVTIHTFRHTCLTRLVQGGMDIVRLSKWAGHANIKITVERYGHLEAADLMEGIDIIEANAGWNNRQTIDEIPTNGTVLQTDATPAQTVPSRHGQARVTH